MFVWISSNFCPLNLLLVRNHQASRIIVKRLVHRRNNVTRVGLNPDHSIRVVETTPLRIRPRYQLLADLTTGTSINFLEVRLRKITSSSNIWSL